jgi:hypothetical protein
MERDMGFRVRASEIGDEEIGDQGDRRQHGEGSADLRGGSVERVVVIVRSSVGRILHRFSPFG